MNKRGPKRVEYERVKRYREEYGITLSQYDEMFKQQKGLCNICQLPERATWGGIVKRLAVDHDHRTGRVRGLLCSRCNAILAKFEDNPNWFERAAIYLRNH